MNEENLKTCRYCAEQIKANAKVCPRCRQWLSIFSFRNLSLLAAVSWVWAAFLFIGFDIHIHQLVKPETDFLPYRNQLSVTESHMSFGTNYENLPYVSVIAIVTNQTDIAWKSVEFDVRFFDKTGTLIDVGPGEYFGTLYPKADGAIRINTTMLHSQADYDSYKIYIGSARDAHSQF